MTNGQVAYISWPGKRMTDVLGEMKLGSAALHHHTQNDMQL